MARKIAVIDLGTNTFNLLIAHVHNDGFETLFHNKIGVALGMGGINEGLLAEDSKQRALSALKQFKSHCSEHQVQEIRAFGTSAIRDAKNGDAFRLQILNDTGIHVQIISGMEEANLIYQGVKWSHNFPNPAVIMDIGGGSTEFILADETGVKKALSLNIGVSRMYQQLTLSDPITSSDIQTIENWLEERSEGKLDGIKCATLIGSSGTFETLHEVHHQEKFPITNECISMPVETLQGVLNQIILSSLSERQKNPFIIPIRQLMIPISAVKINWILKKLEVKNLLISPGSLKEGALR